MLSQYDTVIHSHGSNAEDVPLAVLTWTFLKMTPTEYGPFLIEIEWFLYVFMVQQIQHFQTAIQSASREHSKVYISETALAWARVRKAVALNGRGDLCDVLVARSEPSKNPTKGGKYHPQVDTMALCRHKKSSDG